MTIVWICDMRGILATHDIVECGHRPDISPEVECDGLFEKEKYRAIHRNLFSDGPKPVFIQSDIFTGSIYGYVYYYGLHGLGYYIDPYVMLHVYWI